MEWLQRWSGVESLLHVPGRIHGFDHWSWRLFDWEHSQLRLHWKQHWSGNNIAVSNIVWMSRNVVLKDVTVLADVIGQ